MPNMIATPGGVMEAEEEVVIDEKEHFTYYLLSSGDVIKVKTPVLKILTTKEDALGNSYTGVQAAQSVSVRIKKEDVSKLPVRFSTFQG